MDDAGEGRIRTEREGAQVTVIVDREAKRNALSRHLQDELAATLDGLAADETIGLVVLTGAGDRSFVSGGD
ncbi:MAG: enoyl-CoA hydratase/isomerase family protein, partial [Acidimicrobiia bacterium]|nr:enoyl-CoA hydratase/isomerase family protein [Acidimicrobiia bacterium]